jgi:hypothetical protein
MTLSQRRGRRDMLASEFKQSLSMIPVANLIKDIVFLKEVLQCFRDMQIERLLYWPEEHDLYSKSFPNLAYDAATFRAEKYFSVENQCAYSLETKNELECQIDEAGEIDEDTLHHLQQKLEHTKKSIAASKLNIDKRCRELTSKVDDFLAMVVLNEGECSNVLCTAMKNLSLTTGDILLTWQLELRDRVCSSYHARLNSV